MLQGFQVLHSLTTIHYYPFFIVAILLDMNHILIVILIHLPNDPPEIFSFNRRQSTEKISSAKDTILAGEATQGIFL